MRRSLARRSPTIAACWSRCWRSLFGIARADGPLNAREQEFLRRVHRRLGLDQVAWDRAFGEAAAPADAGDDDDPYLELGVTRSASGEELRAAWKRLMRENHPDSLAARGVPAGFHRAGQRQGGPHQRRLGPHQAGTRAVRHRQIPSWLREVPAPVSDRPALPIIDLPSPNHDERGLTGGYADPALHRHEDGAGGARPAARSGGARCPRIMWWMRTATVFRLVPEDRRAWHAGVSYWRGHAALNGRSIGIEIVNPGHEWGYRDFPVLQMAAVCDLCLAILARHAIPARNVVAHSDVAPDRKEDPGERFDWAGAGARTGSGCGRADAPDLGTTGAMRDAATLRPVRAALAEIGYRVAPEGALDPALSTRAAGVPAALAAGGGDRAGG